MVVQPHYQPNNLGTNQTGDDGDLTAGKFDCFSLFRDQGEFANFYCE